MILQVGRNAETAQNRPSVTIVSPRKYGAMWETLATGRNDRITGSSVPNPTLAPRISGGGAILGFLGM